MEHSNDTYHPVTGVAAFGFEESGVLESLAIRAKHFERPLRCCTTGRSGFDVDLSSAMSGFLNPSNPGSERVDRVHLLIVMDAQQEGHAEILQTVCTTVLDARKKFHSRMGRAILAIRGNFQPVSSSVNGRVRTLPRRNGVRGGTGVDVFDLVVLLDSQKGDGSPPSTLEDAADSHAATLASLMLSDFEESIYKLLEHQRGPLGSGGLYASFGVAELPYSSQDAVQSISTMLWRRMARKIVQDSTTPTPLEPVADSWKEEIEDRLAAEPFESADIFWIDKFHRQGMEKLQRCFEQSEYHSGALLRLLAQREEYLIRFRDRARTRLAELTDAFVPQHAVPISFPRKPEPAMTARREYGWTRITILLLCLMGFSTVLLGNLIAGSVTLPFQSLLVLALLTGSIGTLLLTRKAGTEIVDTPPPPPVQHDGIAELRRHRACEEIATGLLKRHRRLRKSMESDIDALQAEWSRPYALKPPGILTLPESVIDELLTANELGLKQALFGFWEQSEERLTVRPATREKSLPQRLCRYVGSRCALFSGLRMNDALGYLGGSEALENLQVSRAIDRLQLGSSPWMPVDGLASGIVVALPETLNPELRNSITERFQDPVFVVPTKRESIVVLQWTQGFVQSTTATNHRAMAL